MTIRILITLDRQIHIRCLFFFILSTKNCKGKKILFKEKGRKLVLKTVALTVTSH